MTFSFAPQSSARVGYAISALVCLALVVFLLAGWLASRGRRAENPAPPKPTTDHPARIPLPRAAAIALLVTIPLCLLFALRTSVLIFPALTLVLWRGVNPRLLIGTAVLLLGVVVPLLYLVISPRNRGGYNFDYSVELMDAHWVGVAAFVLLGAACWQLIATERSARRAGAQPPGRSISAITTARAEYSRKS